SQIIPSDENIAAAFNRADRHARRVMRVDVEIRVTEDLHLGTAPSRGVLKLNETAEPSAGAAIGDQSCAACGCRIEKLREPTGCAANHAAVVRDCAAGRCRA